MEEGWIKVRMFDERLVGIEMRKVKLLLNKPSYVGFAVLELAKPLTFRYCYSVLPLTHIELFVSHSNVFLNHGNNIMCSISSNSFHNDVMKPKYGKDVQLLFTDTDSLMYEVKTEDI